MAFQLAEDSIATGFLHEAALGCAGADVVGPDILHSADAGGLHGINPADLHSPDSLDAANAGGLHIGDLAHAGGVGTGGLHVADWADLCARDGLGGNLVGAVACGALDIGGAACLGGLHAADIGDAGSLRLVGGDALGGNLVGAVELAEGHFVQPALGGVVVGRYSIGSLADLVVALAQLGGRGSGVFDILVCGGGVGAVFELLGDVAGAFECLVAKAAGGVYSDVRLGSGVFRCKFRDICHLVFERPFFWRFFRVYIKVLAAHAHAARHRVAHSVTSTRHRVVVAAGHRIGHGVVVAAGHRIAHRWGCAHCAAAARHAASSSAAVAHVHCHSISLS